VRRSARGRWSREERERTNVLKKGISSRKEGERSGETNEERGRGGEEPFGFVRPGVGS